jgi:putative copper export protein
VRALYLASVYLHILAAVSWLGGMVFLVVVFVPLLRKPGTAERAALLFHEAGARFRVLGWCALATLAVTGALNVWVRGFGLTDWLTGRVFAGEWGRTLLHKLSLVVVILVVSVLHDFWIGPKAVRLAREQPDSEERAQWRRRASWMGRVTFLLALAIVSFAVRLVR